MPQNLQIGALVLGGILVLIAILGGNFKLFGAEVAATISNRFLRFVAFFFGTILIIVALMPQPKPTENSIAIAVDPTLPAPPPVARVSIKKGELVEVIPNRDFKWTCKGDRGDNWVGPGGDSRYRTSGPDSMLPNAPFCSLIGRVGTGEWHYLGDNNTFIADRSGSLYLTANDTKPGSCPLPNKQECYGDNQANQNATVTINVTPQSKR